MATTTTTNPFHAPAVSPHPTDSAAGSGNSNMDTSGLDEELPPAYTPAPDVQHGESTVQVGPRRPFQAAPPGQHTPHVRPRPPPTINVQSSPLTQTQMMFRQIRDTITSDPPRSTSWLSYPGSRVTRSTSNTGPRSPRPPPLPARPATTTANQPSPESPMSDFAQEFYAAGTGNSPQHRRGSSASSASASTSAPASDVPTSTPTPGRPLLRDGKLLVYPKGFVCRKCRFISFSSLLSLTPSTGSNIGYKHSDPSHPCKKCWNKYAKPFSGPLAYSYSTPSDPSPSSTFQRPLPNFRSPRSPPIPAPAPVPPPHAQPPPPVPLPYASGYGSGYGYNPHPHPHPHPHPQPQPQPHTLSLSPYATPPPGALVYSAGDPRLGGRVCWNCSGKGKVSFFFLDSMTCEVCSGIGRVYG